MSKKSMRWTQPGVQVLTSVIVMLSLTISVAAALPVGAATHSPAQPHWVAQTSPTAADLADVSCSSASECIAVGAKASIVRTVNGGRAWKRVATPYGAAHPSATFASVRCPAPNVCSVLAPPNVVLHTTNGGRTWQTHAITLSPMLAGLSRLACPTPLVCFATASPAGATYTWFTHSAAIFKSGDGNRTWRRLTIPPSVPCPGDCAQRPVGFDLQWISCVSAQTCKAGGDTFIGSHEGYASAVIRTENGGALWTLVHHSFDPNIATCPTHPVCTGVFYQPLTPNIGPYFMRSIDAGTTWSSKNMAKVETSIACTGSTFCELAGPHGALAMAISTSIFKQASPTTHDLAAVACPRMGDCYAVGAGGTILARKR